MKKSYILKFDFQNKSQKNNDLEETIEKLTNKIAKIIEGSKVIASKFKQENGNATNALKK